MRTQRGNYDVTSARIVNDMATTASRNHSTGNATGAMDALHGLTGSTTIRSKTSQVRLKRRNTILQMPPPFPILPKKKPPRESSPDRSLQVHLRALPNNMCITFDHNRGSR